MMATEDPLFNLNCGICEKILSDPVLLGCSHTFDKHCIEKHKVCPDCKTPIASLIPNECVMQMVEEYFQPKKIVEIFLIDTRSSSMKYSNKFFGFIGKSRLDVAKQFILDIIEHRSEDVKREETELMICTFDANLSLGPKAIKSVKEIRQYVDGLKPTGTETALYHSWIELQKLISPMLKTHIIRISIFTDGANTIEMGNMDNIPEEIKKLDDAERILKVTRVVYGMGDSGDTRKLTEKLGATFRHLHEDNIAKLEIDYLEKNLTIRQIDSIMNRRERKRKKNNRKNVSESSLSISVPSNTETLAKILPKVPTHEPEPPNIAPQKRETKLHK